jgi:hypothetical protein
MSAHHRTILLGLFKEDRPRSEPLRSQATGLCLEEAANWSGGAHCEDEMRAYKPSILQVIEALRSYARSLDAHFSVYSVSCLFRGP